MFYLSIFFFVSKNSWHFFPNSNGQFKHQWLVVAAKNAELPECPNLSLSLTLSFPLSHTRTHTDRYTHTHNWLCCCSSSVAVYFGSSCWTDLGFFCFFFVFSHADSLHFYLLLDGNARRQKVKKKSCLSEVWKQYNIHRHPLFWKLEEQLKNTQLCAWTFLN